MKESYVRGRIVPTTYTHAEYFNTIVIFNNYLQARTIRPLHLLQFSYKTKRKDMGPVEGPYLTTKVRHSSSLDCSNL